MKTLRVMIRVNFFFCIIVFKLLKSKFPRGKNPHGNQNEIVLISMFQNYLIIFCEVLQIDFSINI